MNTTKIAATQIEKELDAPLLQQKHEWSEEYEVQSPYMIVEEDLAEVVPMVPERPTESDQDELEGGITGGTRRTAWCEGANHSHNPTT